MKQANTEPQLCVKELGPAIHRSVGFVYKMRMAGFKMEMGRATATAAVQWIRETGFRVVDGRPKLKLQGEG